MGPAESHLNNVDSLRQAQRSVEAKPQDAIDPTHIEEFFDIEDSPKSKASAKQSKSAATALKRETTLAEPLLQGQESMPETIISMPEDVTTSKKSLVAENWKSFAGKSAKAPEFQSLTKAVSSYNKSELATLEQQHQALEVLHAEVQAARDHLNAATNLGRSDALTLIRNTELLDDFELELATLLSTQQQSTAHDPELDGPVPRVLTGTDAVQIALQQRSIKSEGLRDRIGTAVDDLVQAFTDELADKGAIPEKELKEVNQFLDKVTQPLSYGNLMEIIDMSAKSELIKTAQSRLEYLVLFGSTKAELAKQDGETFTDIVKQ